MVAVRKASLETVQLLLNFRANPCVANNLGTTPLHIASKQGNDAIFNLLVNHGADVTARDAVSQFVFEIRTYFIAFPVRVTPIFFMILAKPDTT